MKAFLSFKKQELLKSHDLTKLIGLCKKFDFEFDDFYDLADNLNPYATRFRYPSEFEIPELDDAKLAVRQAESIMRFVLKKITEADLSQTTIFYDQ